MKRLRLLITLMSAFFMTGVLLAQPGTENPHNENSQLVKSLNGYKWKMKMMRPGEGEKQGLHELYPEDIETLVWNPAKVPGDVYTDLWKAGVIEDPYFGRNLVKAQWVQHYEWWYTIQFNVTESTENKKVSIDFDGVDFSCDVWLNGTYLGAHEGAFAGFSFDVTDILRVGKNSRTSANMLTVRLNPPTHVNTKLAGIKTPWFGDYWRDLIPFGIWRDVRMVSTGMVKIDNSYARTTINKDGSADVNMEVTLENMSGTTKEMEVTASIEGKNFESKPQTVTFKCSVAPGKQKVSKNIHVKNPQLWWPWDLGKPNLYTAKISVTEDGKNHDFNKFNFGIREVTMAWNPGFVKDVDLSFPRTTVINGKPIFIRSACWGGTPNIFVGRTAPGTYETLLVQAKEANLNNIRIFGWHNPEIPEFYEICDSLGLTVWQDMIPLGSGNIPKDEQVISHIIDNGISVVKERRNHPSLVMMEGGEEYFLRTRDVEFANNFLMRLGDSLQTYNPIPYVPDSPLNCEASREAGYKSKEATHALAYFYGMGRWLMEDWYRKQDYPIVPEFAITSVPSVESIKKFIPEDELWTPGLSWGFHWADLYHLKMQNFDTFGETFANGELEEFVNATQDSQGVIFQNGVEFFRRQKPRLSGIALCHWITYWPDMKWGIIDAYQKPKRSYEFVKRAYQPLLVSLDFTRRRWHNDEPFKGALWIVNDLYEEYKGCEIKMSVKDDNGIVLKSEKFDVKTIGENSAFKVDDISWDVLSKVDKKFYVELSLTDKDGKEISANEYFFLIGDQKEATLEFNKMNKEMLESSQEYTGGNYLRYYPEVLNEDGKTYESGTQIPRAKGFGTEK
ncbi:MAG: hypothetical protein R3Y50_07790 [Rikenellaceae bacterium]